jgi:cytochrome-b5 reductase
MILLNGPIKTNHTDGEYEPFDLVERTEVAPGHSELVLVRRKPEKWSWGWYESEVPEPVALAQRSPIISVQIKNPSLQIQRSYTPLTLSPNEIHLIVKRYPQGELSKFLHLLTPGVATVWVKQGRHEWMYRENEWDHVVLVVGGTGITPAFQLCRSALQRQKYLVEKQCLTRQTRFTVLAATKDVRTMLLRPQFQNLKDKLDKQIDVCYFIDQVPKGKRLPPDVRPGPITKEVLHDTIVPPSSRKGWFYAGRPTSVTAQEKVMVLVCGPDGFTQYIAGQHGGVAEKQGEQGGLLTDVRGIEVFKLLEGRNEREVVETRGSKMYVMDALR